MQIIDFEKKGNVVRFYLGDASQPYWGDDWNDAPYADADTVDKRFIKGHRDIAFPFDDLVLEPSDGGNLLVSKEDMRQRTFPCIIVVPYELYGYVPWHDKFSDWMGVDGVREYYFGDELKLEDEMEVNR